MSQPASTVADITNSITNVAKAQQNQIITNRVLNSVLLGATQQISTCSCGGRLRLGWLLRRRRAGPLESERRALVDWRLFLQPVERLGHHGRECADNRRGAHYHFWKWGQSRPFVEGGGALTPYEDVDYCAPTPMA